MASNLLEQSVEDIFSTVFDSSPGELLVVNPSHRSLEALVDVAASIEDPPRIHLLGDETTMKGVMEDFLIASNAADLLERGVLSLRTVDEAPENSLIISPSLVVALITIGDTIAGLQTEDEQFVDSAYSAYNARWEEAETFTLRTPPLSQVRETLSTEIDQDVAADFDHVLSSLQTARGDGDGLDEVTISLLVAARNEVLLYDISKWGEDVGIASKATFSRTKTRLEDMGLIDTEKVPIDVGRPRLRLKLGDERLRDASIDQLANVAQTLLN